MINPFFKNTGPHDINFLLKQINLKNDNLPDDKITDIVCNHFDFKPFSIIENLKLKQPIYRKLAAYGHLGRKGMTS